MAEAGDKGIPLEDYIKVQPEPLVRAKLDRDELRYTWTEADGNVRASDDGGPRPPKGWWPRPEFTWFGEHSSCRDMLFSGRSSRCFPLGVSRRRACRHAART